MEIKSKKSIYQKLNVHFFVVALAVAVGVYIALVDSGKYVSDLDLIIIPKNEKTAIQIEKVRGNIIAIFKSRNNIEDVSIKISDGNTLINIESKKYDRSEALEATTSASREIISIASKYYSVKNDLDIRLIKGETEKSKNNIFIVVLLSAVLGGFISFIIQAAVGLIESSATDFIKKKKETLEVSRDIEDMFTRNRSKIEELSYSSGKRENMEREIQKERALPAVEEMEFGSFKKAASPSNLPVESFGNLEDNEITEAGIIPSNLPFEVIDEAPAHAHEPEIFNGSTDEPTEEEYRAKLNQLLRGE